MDSTSHPEGHEEAVTREPEFTDVATICQWLNDAGAKYVLVGGFAIILQGYPRYTTDIDLLIETGPENEARVLSALAKLPDGAARQVQPGEVARYGVIRIGDEVLVDLMKTACDVDYCLAAQSAVTKWIAGVAVPVASREILWRMKQTFREKDIPDRLFLIQWAAQNHVTLDPPVATGPRTESTGWLVRAAHWLERKLGI